MAGRFDLDALLRERPTEAIDRIRSRGVIMLGVGVLACLAGFLMYGNEAFWQSYLIAYMLWLGITVGSLAMLMVQYLSGGAWGMVGRRIFEASSRNLPLMFLLFVPIAINMPTLYSWVHPDGLPADVRAMIDDKHAYLNPTFFLIRAALYFVIWIGLAHFFNRWSKEQDDNPKRLPGPMDGRMRVLAGPGLVLYMLTLTFASVDWVMSLDPTFTSTIFGILMLGAQGLSTLSFTVLVMAAMARTKPFSDVIKPDHFHDFGKLMLAFVMLWAYFSVSQLIIIWSANLPEEIPWYVVRLKGSWLPVSVVVLLGHFSIPFAVLLSRNWKRKASSLSMIAIWVLAMRVVEMTWVVAPAFGRTTMSWLDPAVVIAMGGLWVISFARYLAGRAVVPAHDPYFEEALAHGGH